MNTLFSEAIKLKDGILYNLKYHQERVDRTLLRFYGTRIDLAILNEMIPENKKTGLYKCRIVYGCQIECVEFIPYSLRSIKKVCIVSADDIEYSCKYTDRCYLNRLLETSGGDDIIIVKNNLVTDSFAANLVFESQSGLYTPNSYLLQGTKRQYLLDKEIIKEKEIYMEDITKYSRVFFINALIDLEDNVFVDIASLF